MTVSTSASPTAPATFHCTFSQVTHRSVARKSEPVILKRALSSTSASSSTRADRPSRSRSSADSGVPSSAPACHFACSSDRAAVKAGTSSGRRHDPGSGLTDEIRRGAVGRHSGEDRALGREVLEHLPRQHSPPTSARFGDQQEESIGVALERERLAARHVRMQLEPVTEPERLRPLPIGDAEVADEAGDDVLEAGLCECGQERPRIALPEEAARVRDPKAVAAVVLQTRRSRRSRRR